VVGGDDEVDPELEVVTEELVDDVDLVADEQRENDHRLTPGGAAASTIFTSPASPGARASAACA
jgi:hypothetical protein